MSVQDSKNYFRQVYQAFLDFAANDGTPRPVLPRGSGDAERMIFDRAKRAAAETLVTQANDADAFRSYGDYFGAIGRQGDFMVHNGTAWTNHRAMRLDTNNDGKLDRRDAALVPAADAERYQQGYAFARAVDATQEALDGTLGFGRPNAGHYRMPLADVRLSYANKKNSDGSVRHRFDDTSQNPTADLSNLQHGYGPLPSITVAAPANSYAATAPVVRSAQPAAPTRLDQTAARTRARTDLLALDKQNYPESTNAGYYQGIDAILEEVKGMPYQLAAFHIRSKHPLTEGERAERVTSAETAMAILGRANAYEQGRAPQTLTRQNLATYVSGVSDYLYKQGLQQTVETPQPDAPAEQGTVNADAPVAPSVSTTENNGTSSRTFNQNGTYAVSSGDTLFAIAEANPAMLAAVKGAMGEGTTDRSAVWALTLIIGRKNGIEDISHIRNGATLAAPTDEELRLGAVALKSGIGNDARITWGEISGNATSALLSLTPPATPTVATPNPAPTPATPAPANPAAGPVVLDPQETAGPAGGPAPTPARPAPQASLNPESNFF